MASSKIIVNIQTPFRHRNTLLPRGRQIAYSINNDEDMMDLFNLMNNPMSKNGVYMGESDKKLYEKYVRHKYDRFGNSAFKQSTEMSTSYLEPPQDPENSPFLNPISISKKGDTETKENSEEEVEKSISMLLAESEDKSKLQQAKEELDQQETVDTRIVEEVVEENTEDKSVHIEDLKREFEERFEHLSSAHYTKIQDRAKELEIEYTVKDDTILEILENEFLESAINLGIEDTLEELVESKKK